MIKYFLTFSLIFTVGCRHNQLSPERTAAKAEALRFGPKVDKAVVYFFRSKADIGYTFSSKSYRIEVDGNLVGQLNRKEFSLIVLAPGKHTLKFHTMCNDEEYPILVEANMIYYWGERSVEDKGRILGAPKANFFGGVCIPAERMREYMGKEAEDEISGCNFNDKIPPAGSI